MSTKNSPPSVDVPSTDRPTPIANRLNSDTQWDGEHATVQKVVEDFVGPCPKLGGDRPHVLSYQMPQCIGEAVLTSLSIEPLYRYQRDDESVTAWRVEDTAQALIIYEVPERWDEPVYMLPFLGETQHDLLWMLMHTIDKYSNSFEIQYLTDNTVSSILKVTRPRYRRGVERLIRGHQD